MTGRLIAVAAVFAASFLPLPPAAASHGDTLSKFYAWAPQANSTITSEFEGCRVDVKVYMQEFGKHGVEQHKIRYRAYLGTFSEYAPTADFLRSITFDTGWLISPVFPNDERNFWHTTRIVQTFKFFQSGQATNVPGYTLRARAVGIRPSWWRPDLVVDLPLGHCYPMAIGQ